MANNTHKHPLLISDLIDRGIRFFGSIIAWSYAILIVVIILQVVLRKGFSNGLVSLQELQWHLYAIGIMFGLSYAQVNNAHVRVDILYSNFSQRTKRIIDIIGILTLMLPFIFVVFINGIDFAYNSWRINESSSSPSGLSWRWLIKSVIPISFGMLGLSVLSKLIREVYLLFRGED